MEYGIRVPMLDWSPDLFAQANGTVTTAPLYRKKLTEGQKCACGCGLPHNMAVSALEGEHGSRRVLWFRTIFCKNRKLGIGHAT